MTDEELALRVAEELAFDPRVDSEAITVSAHGGIVALAGTVATVRQKREAHKAAGRVHGVAMVKDELDVRIPTEHRRGAGEAELLITREWAILAGENDHTTDMFQQITGRPPRPVSEFLHDYRTAFLSCPRVNHDPLGGSSAAPANAPSAPPRA